MEEFDIMFAEPMKQLNKLAKVKKIPCDCVGGTSELICDENLSFDVELINGVLQVMPTDISSGFENFRCRYCGMELDNRTYEFDIEYNG